MFELYTNRIELHTDGIEGHIPNRFGDNTNRVELYTSAYKYVLHKPLMSHHMQPVKHAPL